MKKSLKIVGISILLLILFRGFIYRLFIKYNDIGTRPEIEITNRELIEIVERKAKNKQIDLITIVKIADEITKEELKFSSNQVSNNPNELIITKEANCIGYSAFFNSTANYLIRKNKLQSEIQAEHKIGQLKLLGIDLHQFFESPFFKDHDFNEVININTNEKISVDPSMSDYFWINRIAKIE